MEIRLKTAEEFHDAHMTIEIRATPEEVWGLSKKINQPSVNRKRVAELEDELERYRRAHVCTGRCTPNAHVAFEGNRLITDLEEKLAAERQRAEVAETSLAESRALVEFKNQLADGRDQDLDRLTAKIKELTLKADEERRRASGLKDRLSTAHEEADAQEHRHDQERRTAAQNLAARDRLLAAATTRVKAAQEILSRPVVIGARNDIVTSKGAILADAIGNALIALSE